MAHPKLRSKMMRSAPTKHCHCSRTRFTSAERRASMRSEKETAMQHETSAVLASKNQDRGFFGKIRHHAEPHPAWALTMEAIVNATACSDEAARDFLDSRYRRHLADEVVNALVGRLKLPAANRQRVARWMRRRI